MISIVIPAFNESTRLPPTLADILDYYMDYEHLIDEIIVVDDGSTDSTVERALYWQAKLPLRVERMAVNSGKWAAIHKGISCAKNDAILLLDADGSASAQELRNISVRNCVEKQIAVFGSRFMKGSSTEGKSKLRILVSRAYRSLANFAYWIVTGKSDVDDMQAPFKLIHRSQIRRPVQVSRFAGDIELACAMKGVVIHNHPLQFMHVRGSKLPTSSVFNMFVDTIKVVYRMKFKVHSNTVESNIVVTQ